MPVEKAERELLVKYLGAFGPTTLQDFALWAGMYVRDAKPIWQGEAENLVHVDVEGWKASILQSDLPDLEKAELDEAVVRLLPYFDSFLLGHKSHRNIVDQGKPQEDLSQSRMGLPGPSSGWQSARRMVPSTEQEQSHSPHDSLLKNFKSRFFADKRRSFRPRQIPRMLRRQDCYRMSKPQQSGNITIYRPRNLEGMNKAVSSRLHFRSRNGNLPPPLNTHHPQNENRKGCKNLRWNPGEPGLASNYDNYRSQHRSDSIDFASKDQRNLSGQHISQHSTSHTSEHA